MKISAGIRLIASAYWIWSLDISSSNFQFGRSHPYWKYTFLYFLSSMDANCHTGNLSWKYTGPGYLQYGYRYWICWHSVKSAFSLRMHATTFDTGTSRFFFSEQMRRHNWKFFWKYTFPECVFARASILEIYFCSKLEITKYCIFFPVQTRVGGKNHPNSGKMGFRTVYRKNIQYGHWIFFYRFSTDARLSYWRLSYWKYTGPVHGCGQPYILTTPKGMDETI